MSAQSVHVPSNLKEAYANGPTLLIFYDRNGSRF